MVYKAEFIILFKFKESYRFDPKIIEKKYASIMENNDTNFIYNPPVGIRIFYKDDAISITWMSSGPKDSFVYGKIEQLLNDLFSYDFFLFVTNITIRLSSFIDISEDNIKEIEKVVGVNTVFNDCNHWMLNGTKDLPSVSIDSLVLPISLTNHLEKMTIMNEHKDYLCLCTSIYNRNLTKVPCFINNDFGTLAPLLYKIAQEENDKISSKIIGFCNEY